MCREVENNISLLSVVLSLWLSGSESRLLTGAVNTGDLLPPPPSSLLLELRPRTGPSSSPRYQWGNNCNNWGGGGGGGVTWQQVFSLSYLLSCYALQCNSRQSQQLALYIRPHIHMWCYVYNILKMFYKEIFHILYIDIYFYNNQFSICRMDSICGAVTAGMVHVQITNRNFLLIFLKLLNCFQ